MDLKFVLCVGFIILDIAATHDAAELLPPGLARRSRGNHPYGFGPHRSVLVFRLRPRPRPVPGRGFNLMRDMMGPNLPPPLFHSRPPFPRLPLFPLFNRRTRPVAQNPTNVQPNPIEQLIAELDTLPDSYDNVAHKVSFKDDQRLEVNDSIVKSSNDEGNFATRNIVLKVSPQNSVPKPTFPGVPDHRVNLVDSDDADLEKMLEEPMLKTETPERISRRKRGAVVPNFLKNLYQMHVSASHPEQPRHGPRYTYGEYNSGHNSQNRLRYTPFRDLSSDTDVNFVGDQTMDRDAEVFSRSHYVSGVPQGLPQDNSVKKFPKKRTLLRDLSGDTLVNRYAERDKINPDADLVPQLGYWKAGSPKNMFRDLSKDTIVNNFVGTGYVDDDAEFLAIPRSAKPYPAAHTPNRQNIKHFQALPKNTVANSGYVHHSKARVTSGSTTNFSKKISSSHFKRHYSNKHSVNNFSKTKTVTKHSKTFRKSKQFSKTQSSNFYSSYPARDLTRDTLVNNFATEIEPDAEML